VRIHRVHTHHSLQPDCEVIIRDKQAHYLTRVLRVVAGQRVLLFNGDGYDYVAEVLRPGKKELYLEVVSRLPAVKEPELEIMVVQAISKGDRMDQTLQKCTELGVTVFQPLFSGRVEVRLKAEKLASRLEHWRAVVTSACEQSGRAVVPAVLAPLSLAEWINMPGQGQRLVLAPGAGMPLSRVQFGHSLQLAVGPEGGFSEIELGLMKSHEVRPVSLGPRILRTETAAPAGVAVIQALAGDFS